jgi:hypothetical protein
VRNRGIFMIIKLSAIDRLAAAYRLTLTSKNHAARIIGFVPGGTHQCTL